jgi:hypothetical protein
VRPQRRFPWAYSPIQLTVAQAQAVQTQLLGGLFEAKNQAPITVGGQTYTATTADTQAMAHQIAAASQQVIDAVHAEIGTAAQSAASGAVANVNTATASYNTAFDTQFGHGPVGGGASGTVLQTLNFNFAEIASSTFGTVLQMAWNQTPIGAASTPTITPTEATGPTMTWPNSSGQSQSLTFSQMSALLKSITDRRTALQTTRASKQNDINNLSSVADLAQYDITAGW